MIKFNIALFFVFSDIAFSDGKVGDYLFVGNFVYTVSLFTIASRDLIKKKLVLHG